MGKESSSVGGDTEKSAKYFTYVRSLGNGRERVVTIDPDSGIHIMSVEGSALLQNWHSPIPEGAFIDLRPLMRLVRSVNSGHSIQQGE